MSHRTVLISRETTLVLFVAIQQENGVIHRNTQLQYRRQRFCNVTDLTKENVTSQIIYNRCTYTDQEKIGTRKDSPVISNTRKERIAAITT